MYVYFFIHVMVTLSTLLGPLKCCVVTNNNFSAIFAFNNAKLVVKKEPHCKIQNSSPQNVYNLKQII